MMNLITSTILTLVTLLSVTANAGQTVQRQLVADSIEGQIFGKNLITRNATAEKNLRGWSTFDDGAVSIPVDMTGGSASQVTLTRTTTAGDVLNGRASFEITKAAADAQGEGVSIEIDVPEGYRGKQLLISFPFKINSGSLVEGDLAVYLYDVTNSTVIVPENNGIVGARGTLFAIATTADTTASLRFGFMFRTTSTTAVTISFDDVSVGPSKASNGAVTTDWVSYPIVVTATSVNPVQGVGAVERAYWRRVGDSMEVMYQYVQTAAGTNATGDLLYPLPNPYLIDTTKQLVSTSPLYIVGSGKLSDAANGDGSGFNIAPYAYNSSTLSVAVQSAATTWDNIGGSYANYSNTNRSMTFLARVPIQGWSSNVTLSSSSVFNISNILATGTRVTATPIQLGEYRSKYKTASSNNYQVWTDTAPTDAPSAVNGMRLYSDPFNAAGTAGEPNAYEIFVGRNKHIKLFVYRSTGKTNALDFSYMNQGTATALGVINNYDPTTGVLYVSAGSHGGSVTTSYLGWDQGSALNYADGYFDVVVSENALAVGVDSIPSQIVILKDEQPSGTASGTFTAGSWQTRVLNTVVNPNSVSWISLSSNQFTLQPGKYKIKARAPGLKVGGHAAKIRNITDSTDALIGNGTYSSTIAGSQSPTDSFVDGFITINSSKTFELQHRCTDTFAANGLGWTNGFGVNEVFAEIEIEKI